MSRSSTDMRRTTRLVAALFALCVAPLSADAETPVGSALAHEALALCHSALQLPAAERSAVLASGLARAKEAVAGDSTDALAHFAVFCNLGRRLEASGLSFGVLRHVRHARDALDRVLDLSPAFADAMAAKGALLFRLPGLLGGDEAEGERLLRRALALDPENVHTRVLLAEVLRPHGTGKQPTGPDTVSQLQ